MTLLRVRDLRKSYGRPDSHRVEALTGVDLQVSAGDFVVVVGHNGCGKSTLLSILGGELSDWQGSVELEGQAVRSPGREIMLLKQDPRRNVAPDLSVEENLQLASLRRRPSPFRVSSPPVENTGMGWIEGATRQQKADTLSGGQRQLLGIQVALAQAPRVLLLDEPTASLDQENARAVLDLLQATWRKGIAVVMVTHDLATARLAGNRLVIMRDGRIASELRGPDRSEVSLEELYVRCGFGMAGSDPGGARQG